MLVGLVATPTQVGVAGVTATQPFQGLRSSVDGTLLSQGYQSGTLGWN